MTMTTLIAVAAASLVAGQVSNIDRYLQADLRDMTFSVKILKSSQAELKKINHDFGMSYKYTSAEFYFKEPLKMRIEGHVEETNVVYIINGPTMIARVSGFSAHEDLSKRPGQRQTLLDVGIATPGQMEGLFDAKFVRMDRETGEPVFDLTYKPGMDDSSRYRVWIDPVKKYVTKREWFNQYGRQLATFNYSDPKEVGGCWVPTRLEVKNVEGIVAGVTSYVGIKVNTGLPDSMFTK